uniref:Uncharacterized protein n=1 Tax=Ditylenchus dipsaci TaxID=166011 RepID=A0A915E9C5_9BILA
MEAKSKEAISEKRKQSVMSRWNKSSAKKKERVKATEKTSEQGHRSVVRLQLVMQIAEGNGPNSARNESETLGMKRSHQKAFPESSHVQQTPEVSNCYVNADPLGDFQWGIECSLKLLKSGQEASPISLFKNRKWCPANYCPFTLERSMDSDFGFEDLSPKKEHSSIDRKQRYFLLRLL